MGIEHNPSSDSVAVVKWPQTMARRGPLLELGMFGRIVCCESLGGSK